MVIQWYPGHMAKTKRIIKENISLVDIVIELLDARIPISSRNPDIDKLAGAKKRLIVLNKADLADESINNKWISYFEKNNIKTILVNSHKGKGVQQIYDTSKLLMADKIKRQLDRGRIFVPIRAMIVGIPNVGKSTLINKLVDKKITQTGDRPGVTRSKQWVRIKKDFELLDTPGILWPKFDDEDVAFNLAYTGAIKDDVIDIYNLGVNLAKKLSQTNVLKNRYGFDSDNLSGEILLEKIGEQRGFKLKGGIIDTEKAAIILLDEFRGMKLGRISLESPQNLI